mgnify:CR=1 FL=1
MSKITLIKSDRLVIRGNEVNNEFGFNDLPENFHALQWESDINKGEIEWTDKRNEKVTSEDEINEKLGINLTQFVNLAFVAPEIITE